MNINDLLYIGESEPFHEVSKLATDAGYKVSDGSDDFHPYRLVIESDVDDDTHYLWLLRNGLFEMSLHFQLTSMDTPDRVLPLMRQVIAEQNGGAQ